MKSLIGSVDLAAMRQQVNTAEMAGLCKVNIVCEVSFGDIILKLIISRANSFCMYQCACAWQRTNASMRELDVVAWSVREE